MTTMPVSGITPVRDDAPAGADLVLRNAKIFTGDPGRPAASAVAVRDGRIVALGDDRDVAGHVGARTRVVDALGRRAVPGLNDSHLHVIRGGLNYVLELRWDGVPTLRQRWRCSGSRRAARPRAIGSASSAAGRPTSSPSAACRP